ncbi:MAG: 6-phosphogluconolactonase [Oligoflexia bacterium]|nr:6-phosphogluconolactonase [Oligoflexia bacterium]
MKTQVLPDADALARRAAAIIAEQAVIAVRARSRFMVAFSGGRSPWRMLALLADMPLPWARFHVFQVDERAVPLGDPARNLGRLQAVLLDRVPIPADQVYAMPVDDVATLPAGAADYQATLRRVAADPPVLDLVHLGLGPDGHTASLVPGDPVLDLNDADVGVSGPYQGAPRMTLTFPVLARARRILWVVSGASKLAALARLRAGDRSIPAGRLPSARAVLLADLAAVEGSADSAVPDSVQGDS